MHRGNRRLQAVRPESPRGQRSLHQRTPFGDQCGIPARPILVVQQNQFSARRAPRRPPRLMQQHQRQQAHDLRLRQQLHQQPTQPNRFAGQVFARQLSAHRRRIAFVEHQINHPQHAVEALGQFAQAGDLIRDFGVTNLGLGAHDALGNRRRCREKRAGDFLGAQVADFTQGQRHLRIRRQRRVTTGEDQPQAVVFHIFTTPVGLFQFFELRQQQRLRGFEAGAAAQHIDGLETPGGHQPGARTVRHAIALPALDCDEERLVQGFFGEIEIPQQANQRRQNPPRVFAIDLLDPCPNVRHSTAAPGALRRSRPGPPECCRQPGWLR